MNKLIVVTGGTKGIGRAIVEKFAAAGFDVVTCARNEKELDQLRTDVKKANSSVEVITLRSDMGKKEDIVSFCKHVKGLNRPVDILVNNAGYFVPGEISTEPEGTLEKMMQANLFSAYQITRAFVAGMKERKVGHIFNMCSIASLKAYPNGGSYSITKFALLGFSKCLREELKSFNIRVTSIMPGATLTASWEGVDLPEDRFMKAADIADTIFYSYQLSARSVVEEIVIRPQLGDI
jgi:short-subunit dehydrogenase